MLAGYIQKFRHAAHLLLPFAAVLALAQLTQAQTVQDFARLGGQGRSVLQGIGLVVGLNKTGDDGKELAMARPLAAMLQNQGVPIGKMADLEKGKSVALVQVMCRLPETGALTNDTFDVSVSTLGSCSSLRGGRLYLTAMRGPFKNDPDIYAFAEGPIELDDSTITTNGRVRGGAQLVTDIKMEPVGDEFELVVEPNFVGWGTTAAIAEAINAESGDPSQGREGRRIAIAVDDRTVRVVVPESERVQRANFMRDVLKAPVNTSAMPATVIVNQRNGAIILTGNVAIGPVAITHKSLIITTTVPTPAPTQDNPLVTRDRWARADVPVTNPADAARLSDLIAAFKQLDISVFDQIEILQMLHKTGSLKAKIVID
jgi:flagellar P-ring protein precursor FlgI